MGNRANTLRIAVREFDPFENALNKIWNNYCEEKDCELELDLVPLDLDSLYNQTLKEEGLKKGEWDIAHMNTDWIAEAYASNAIKNLTPFIESNPPENYPEGWTDSMLKMQKFESEIVGLPFHDGPECLIYRKDLFKDPAEKEKFYDKYGSELKPPKTWQDFLTVARFFQRPDEGLYGSVFAAYPDGHNTVFDFCLQLWTRDGELVDKNENIHINTKEAREGLEFYRSILRDDTAVHPDCADFDSVKSGLSFVRGEVALMVNWFGFASLCEVHEESKTKGKVDVTSIPKGPSGEEVSLNVYWMYTIGSGSPHKEIAYDFIKYAINPENDKLLTLEGGIGCRISTWEDPDVNELVPYYSQLEDIHSYAKELPRRKDWSKIARIIDEVVLTVMNTDKAVGNILENGQKEIDRLIN